MSNIIKYITYTIQMYGDSMFFFFKRDYFYLARMHSVDLFKSDSTHIYNITKDFKFKKN